MENLQLFRIEEKAMVSPLITNKDNWTIGEIIQIESNPFKGIVISVKTPDGEIYFDQQMYFQKAS